MKKLVSFVVSFALLLMVSIPISASAQQISIDECHNHDDCCAEVVKEVPLTPEMLQQAQKMNAIPNSASLVTTTATCSHTYSSWETIKEWYETSSTFGNCYILAQYQMRYCTKCNVSFARETRTQLSHIKVGTSSSWKCSRCGLSGGTV